MGKKAYKLCKLGIKQKFLENEGPKSVLVQKTTGKHIVECTKDSTWGCGLALNDDDCLNPQKWTNQGIMGTMLEEIRQELNELPQPQPQPLPQPQQ